MTIYSYTAKDKEGKSYQGTHEAASRVELYAAIREEGGTVIEVKETRPGISLGGIFNSLFKGIKTHDKILLARNLGTMIKAGLSVTRALAVMEKQAKNKNLKQLLSDLASDVSKGETLSDSMRKRPHIFSSLFVSMVKAGEESGNLSNSLEIVASQMDKSFALTKKVKGALIYPAVILSAMIVIAILMLVYMVPTLTATFKGIGAELPLSTRVIIAASDFMVNHTFIVLGALLGLIVGGTFALKSAPGQRVMDIVSIRIPVIGEIVKEVQSARAARTLSSLLSSGVDVVVALGVTIDVVQNSLYKKTLDVARTVIQKGEPMSSVFMEYEGLYPPFVGEMIAVGEETGKISDMLLQVAIYYEAEVEEKTKDLSTIIEPVLMIIIGAGVGVFAISMLAPTYSLVNNI
ncbi:MAG: pilus assembly protein PilC, type pilus assembly protein PilC [Parcubacteria group bacterium]|nr:pilus assembly protein PilC, type pilus assembly protein PilC [Parcubacteria group bacterium]